MFSLKKINKPCIGSIHLLLTDTIICMRLFWKELTIKYKFATLFSSKDEKINLAKNRLVMLV